MKLQNKVVLVTGGANGIGKSCVKAFYNEGMKVIFIDTDIKNGKKLLEELNGECLFFEASVSNEITIQNIMEFLKLKNIKIDILINNASIQQEQLLYNTDILEFKKVIDVNLNGVFICTKILSQIMNREGKILNISSVHHNIPRKGKYAYDISKSGVNLLTKELAIELIEKNITVNVLAIGACETSLNDNWRFNKYKRDKVLKKIPLRWIATPDEISTIVLNIIKNFSSYTTGSIFTIDGGRSLNVKS